MRFTYRIMALPLLTAVTFVMVFVALFANFREGNRLLQHLQTESYTAITLSHGLEIEAMRIWHGLNMAAILQDSERVRETERMATRFRELLEAGSQVISVEPAQIADIGTTFDRYDGLARGVAMAVIADPARAESPEVLAEFDAMSDAYRDLRAALDRLTASQVRYVNDALSDTRENLARRARHATLAATAAVIVLVFMAAGAILSVVRPLRKLSTAAAAIARGDLDQDIAYHSDDDLGRFVASFREMQQALEADIARREEIEHALRDSESRLALALDAANDGIWDIDIPRDLFYASDRFAAILGYASDEKPRSLAEVEAMLHGIESEDLRGLFRDERPDGREASFEARLQRKDGTWTWVEIKGRTVERQPDGRPRRLVGTISDISERKSAEQELRRAQDRALQSEKLASLGRLVAGLAHELNSPLGALVSSSDLTVRSAAILRERMGGDDCPPDIEADPRLQKALIAIEQGATGTASATARLDELLSSLRRFSALDRADLREVDVHELLDATVTVTPEVKPGGVEVVRDYADLPRIVCNPGQLNQLFLAIVRNAVEAMDGHGILTLQTSVGRDDTVRIAIGDTGSGIPADQLEHLFEPGFRTSSDRVHLGWGLVTAVRIAEEHDGAIDADSEEGHGSTFTVTLPIRPRRRSEGQ